MRTLKHILEKPGLIWSVVILLYGTVYWMLLKETPFSDKEQRIFDVIKNFSESGFPPTIHVMRTLPDWGHLGFYTLMGTVYSRFAKVFAQDPTLIRIVSLTLMGAVFFFFVRLGKHFTYKNRLNPLWISLGLLVFALNPYSWESAFHLGYMALFLFFLLLALYLYEKEWLAWASLFAAVAVLVDWRGLLLALAFLLARLRSFQGKIIRPERMLFLLFPFLVASLPIIAWKGIVPQGEAREWWQQMQEKSGFSIEGLFYTLIILPLYTPFFSWAWGIRARIRALTAGGILTAIAIPFYFIFPIQFDAFSSMHYSLEVPLGIVDHGAVFVAGPYKNLLLFIPWLAGVFLCMQLFLMEIFDRSRILRYFIVFYLLIQPFVIGYGDEEFLMVLPFALLLTLSESLVGEEGKIA
jgi:hypothetical protein